MDWILAIGILAIKLVIVFTLVQTLFSFVYLYIETQLNPEAYPSTALYIIGKNYFLEVVLVLSKYALFPIKFLPLRINIDPSATKIVLLVHGYMRSKTDWIPLLFHLQNTTKYPILSINLSNSAAFSMQQFAANLKAQVDKLVIQFTMLEEITLIGHSMGGLVCAYYQEYLAETSMIKTIITLGTPFYGTKVATLGLGQSSQQMLPNSKFLLVLREKINQSTTTNYKQIASNLDNLIFPWQSSILADKNQYLILNNITHLELISNKQSAAIIAAWL
jgi:triacylglycerol lipase